MGITPSLQTYIEQHILPRYDHFDAAHQRNHADTVVEQSLMLAKYYKVNINMVYAIAAYHDTGLCENRKTHHLISGRIIRDDHQLHQWFIDEEIETMAQAAEDHRASSDHEPRSIYGKIVAEADRVIEPRIIIERTIQYGLAHYPELDEEGQYQRVQAHLKEKYGDGGYLKLWIPQSDNANQLEILRVIIRDEHQLRNTFNDVYQSLKDSAYD